MQPRVAHTAAALIVGNELLSGKVPEGNLIELIGPLTPQIEAAHPGGHGPH